MTYRAIYKCRLCGEEFKYCQTGEEIAQTANMVLTVYGHAKHIKGARDIYKNVNHYCKDGSFGFADFQGFKKVED